MDELTLYSTDLSKIHPGSDSSHNITWIYYWVIKWTKNNLQ